MRLLNERAFHDRQASARAAHLRPCDLAFHDDEYLDHASWIRPALAGLGDVAGRDVLDLGCGHGMAAVVLARRGARVVAVDLSAGYLSEARRRAAANGVRIAFIQADGQRLPFAAASFDAIWGNAILHHLEPRAAALELNRVLRPSGRAVFCEPWDGNPLLRWARARLPYPQKHRTEDETPLRPTDLHALREVFSDVQVEGHQLIAMAARLLGPARRLRGLAACDRVLLRRWPGLACWCRYVVLQIRKIT